MALRNITNLFRLKPFQKVLLWHKKDYITPIQIYVKKQRNFVSLPINSVIISKKEFMNKTNCAWVEKWQVKKTNSANPLMLSFIFRKHKKLQQYDLVLQYFSAISHLIKI